MITAVFPGWVTVYEVESLILEDINGKIKSCKRYNHIRKIEVNNTSINIKCVKLIDILQETYLENSESIDKKLIICGYVQIILHVYAENGFYSKKKNIPFNTSIIVPSNIIQEHIVNIFYDIEDITAIDTEDSLIFISITLLFKYISTNNLHLTIDTEE